MSTRAERTAVIDTLEQKFKVASGIYVADNNRVNVEKVTELRRNLRKEGVSFLVVKNSLAKEAFKRIGIESLNEHFKGPTAVAVTENDSTVPAKVLRDFQKENKNLLNIKAAYVDGSAFSGEQATKLADLPSKDTLIAMFLGCLKQPVGNMAGVLNGITTKFVRTVDALRDKKEKEQ
ncbi:50S ribosomal protein L10 [Chitinispirillales bacterium ANBcel5]|uniref:50S ribosomal protein L10 n=1 Tax=Cellulosispirillum alkaliphilum TaxID=3039283 RepID=UPI002A5559F3|nr:50S ribosomal protein L10 [Chitinispirillales bacterium ANBcel5]